MSPRFRFPPTVSPPLSGHDGHSAILSITCWIASSYRDAWPVTISHMVKDRCALILRRQILCRACYRRRIPRHFQRVDLHLVQRALVHGRAIFQGGRRYACKQAYALVRLMSVIKETAAARLSGSSHAFLEIYQPKDRPPIMSVAFLSPAPGT